MISPVTVNGNQPSIPPPVTGPLASFPTTARNAARGVCLNEDELSGEDPSDHPLGGVITFPDLDCAEALANRRLNRAGPAAKAPSFVTVSQPLSPNFSITSTISPWLARRACPQLC